MDLSIIIVNWNTRDLLRACLTSLRAALAGNSGKDAETRGRGDAGTRRRGDAETRGRAAGEKRGSGEEGKATDLNTQHPTPNTQHPLLAEILVIDNASTDGSAEMVRAEFPEARLIANATNAGYAAGNNQGFAEARGAFWLLLNPDTELPPDALARLVRFLEERPQAGAVAPRLVHPDGRVQRSLRGFPTPAALLGEVTGLARLAPRGPWAGYRGPAEEPEEPLPVDQPMASCLLFRREAIEQAGGMDAGFPIFFNDVDLCRRVKDKGWEIWYDPTVAIIHHGGASTRQVRPRMVWESHRSLHRYYQKHYRGRIFRPLYGLIVAAIYGAGALRYGWARLREGRGKTVHAC